MPTVTRTYSNFQKWDNHPLCDQLEKAIHICASSSMCTGINLAYPKYTNICSINNLMQRLFKTWNSSEFQLEQYLGLSSWLQKNQTQFPYKELYEAFQANKKGIVMLMRKLTESGVEPKELERTFRDMNLRGQSVSAKERLFLNVWQELDTSVQSTKMSYADYRKKVESDNISLEVLNNVLVDIAGSTARELTLKPVIFLHGFYFITPEQQFFLEKITKEFDVVMFMYYEPQYERTFNFMDSFIQPIYGWEPLAKEKADSDFIRNHISDLFLRVYQNDSEPYQAGTKSVKVYENFFEYTQSVISPNYQKGLLSPNEKNFEIFAPNASHMNELLINHYPELDRKNRNFLSYPVGRFFSTIHEIYKDGEYEVSFDQLHELFTSGWLYNYETNENARNFTYDLKNIQSYVERAKTLNDWIDLCEKLKGQLLFIENQFPLPVDASRMQKSTRSPFTKNSHFSIEIDRLNNIIQFLYEINTICDELFENGQLGTKINLHFKRLERLMNKRINRVQQGFNNVEKSLVEDLRGRLSMIQSDSDFFYNDLHEAVSLYLSGKFDTKQEELIRPFTEIDSEAFKHCKVSHNYKVFVGGLDEDALPITPEVFHWPLQKDTWLSLSEHKPRIAYDYMRKDAKKYISRYLFYIMLRFIPANQLNLSWIRHFLSKEERKSALYIRQLGLPLDDASLSLPEKKKDNERLLTSLIYSKEEVEQGYSTLVYTDFFAEYVQCPKRFYYSYLMQDYPVFQQGFIQMFLYTELVKISAKNTGINSKSLYDELDPFFPQWIKVKKSFEFRNALNYAYGKNKIQQKVEESLYVSEIRKNFQFPGLKNHKRNELFDKANSSHLKIEQAIMEEEAVSLEANPGYHCRFCPHIDICPSATYGIDLKGNQNE